MLTCYILTHHINKNILRKNPKSRENEITGMLKPMIPTTSESKQYVNSSPGRDVTQLDAMTITLQIQQLTPSIHLHKKRQPQLIVEIKKIKFAGSTDVI